MPPDVRLDLERPMTKKKVPEILDRTVIKCQATEPKWGFALGEVNLVTHGPDKCSGEHCVIHNPSDHHMRDWPLMWRADRKMMERTCEHGVGHPDPDDMDHKKRTGSKDDGTHGCDGCCTRSTDVDGSVTS